MSYQRDFVHSLIFQFTGIKPKIPNDLMMEILTRSMDLKY